MAAEEVEGYGSESRGPETVIADGGSRQRHRGRGGTTAEEEVRGRLAAGEGDGEIGGGRRPW